MSATQKPDLSKLVIKHGSHRPPSDPASEREVCVMEAVAWFAGEPHSDHPACACPVVTGFAIRLNDRMPTDDMRTRLLTPLIPKIVGSRSTRAVEVKRYYLAADAAVRIFAPAALEARKFPEQAAKLRALPELVDVASARAAAAASRAVRAELWDKAKGWWRSAADAAYDAAAAAAAADAASAAADAAYAAADAAYAAAAAYDAREKVFVLGVETIERMLAIKE